MTISFSGLDGAGKTTQIKMLLETYQNLGAKVVSIYTYLPDIRYHSAKELHILYQRLCAYDVIHIRYRLNSDKNFHIMQQLERKIPPQRFLATVATIQDYLDHRELSKFVLKPLLAEKKTLIFDRYYYDELAFKYVYGCPKFILESIYRNAKNTNWGFSLKISSEECIKRNQSRPDSIVALYQTKASIDALVGRFDCIAEKKKLIFLDGTCTKEVIAALVLKQIALL